MVTDRQQILLRLAEVLEGLEIRYAIGGSLASGHHGEIRATNDVDVLIEVGIMGIRPLADALGPDFHLDVYAMEQAITLGGSFSAIYLPTVLKVDFLVADDGKLDRLQLQRRLAVRVDETDQRTVYFTSPEDVILRKLDRLRQSGNVLERQLRDAAGVVKARAEDLDLTYLRHAAGSLGLEAQLQRLLEDAGAA